MQAIDKLKSDMDDWKRRSSKPAGNGDFDALRLTFARAIPNLPSETLAAVFATFLSRYDRVDAEKALEWLAGVGSLLLMDYDGTPFTREEWSEIRELATVDSGEIDMDLLSYVLTEVLDHDGI